MNENENTVYWNLLDTTKVVLRGEFIDINTYIEKEKNTNQLLDLLPLEIKNRKKKIKLNPNQVEGKNNKYQSTN